MFGAAQVLRLNEHVRVDIFYGWYPTRMKVVVEDDGAASNRVYRLIKKDE